MILATNDSCIIASAIFKLIFRNACIQTDKTTRLADELEEKCFTYILISAKLKTSASLFTPLKRTFSR